MWFQTAAWLALALSPAPLQGGPQPPSNRPVFVTLDEAERVHGRLTALAPDSLAPQRRRAVLRVLRELLAQSDSHAKTKAQRDAWLAEHDAHVELESDGDRITFLYDCPPAEHVALFDELISWARGVRIDELSSRAAAEAYLGELRALDEDSTRFDDTAAVDAALGAGSWPSPNSDVFAAMLPTTFVETQREMWGRSSTLCSAAGPGDGAAWLARATDFLKTQPKDRRAYARPPRSVASERAVVVDVPGRSTTDVRVFWDAYLGDDDYAALWLWTEIATREEDTNPEFRWASVPSLFPRSEAERGLYVFGTVEPGETLRELERLRGFLEQARELEEPKFLLMRRALVRELRDAEGAPEEPLRRAEEALRDRTPAALWPQLLTRLEALDYASYQETAARALAGPMRWVATGPAEALRWPADVEVRPGRAIATTTPEGQVLADRLLAALGGREVWSTLEGFRSVRKVLVAELEEPIDVHIWVDLDGGRLCVEQDLPGTPLLYVLRERSGWRRAGSQVSELSSSVHGALWQRQQRTLFRVLRSLARGGELTARTGEEGRLELFRQGAPWCWITLDGDGRPERLGYQIPGERLETQYLFKDWDEVQGFLYARHVHQLERGTETKTLTQEFNPAFDPELFERP